MTGLVLDDVTVRYGQVVAVDGLSLDVEEGEVVALLGPSGCGKSSVLRAIAGLEPVVGGSVRFGGRDLAGVAVHQRELGLMFQDHVLFPNLDVAQNVAFGLRMHGWRRDRIRSRTTELLELVGLAGYGDRPTTALSGGEAQRVALARALAPEPRLLMLDEPLGALDRGLREQLARDLRRLLNALGQTALHVTHDQSEAFTVADRVAIMRAGQLVQVGSPAEVWSAPRDEFVARFLGHDNIWTIEVDGRGEARWGAISLGPIDAPPSSTVSIVVPASAITIADDGPIAAEVELVEPREGGWRLTCRTASGDVVVLADEPTLRGARLHLVPHLERGAPL